MALIQALFSGPDLIRIIVYFFVGLVLAGLGVVGYGYLRERRSHPPSMNNLVRAARMQADLPKTAPVELSKPEKERVWADVKPEDLIAIDNMDNLTRNERNRLLEPFTGQWLTVGGVVDDVQGRADDPTVYVYIREREHRVIADFNKDKIRASSLRKRIAIRVIGSFHHVQGYIESIYLENCEFVEKDRSGAPLRPPEIQEPPLSKESPAGVPAHKEKPGQVVDQLDALVAEDGRELYGVGVGKTGTFRVTKNFGFKWVPSSGIVIGGLHGTLNGIPHTWTFDNNLNPYFPAKHAPPPDVPGDYYFSVDNIKPGTRWTITILHEQPDN